jgi:hypothetical protein
MISLKHKFIFVHIPKTGGSSVVKLLRTKHETCEIKETAHQSAIAIKKRYFFCDESYSVFSIVRNPYERMISYFFHMNLRNGKNFKHFEIDEFIKFLLKGHVTKERGPFPSQYSYIKGGNVEIIHFENYENDLKRILLGYGIDEPIPNVNKTKHRHYSFYYNNVAREIIEYLYSDDLERCGI